MFNCPKEENFPCLRACNRPPWEFFLSDKVLTSLLMVWLHPVFCTHISKAKDWITAFPVMDLTHSFPQLRSTFAGSKGFLWTLLDLRKWSKSLHWAFQAPKRHNTKVFSSYTACTSIPAQWPSPSSLSLSLSIPCPYCAVLSSSPLLSTMRTIGDVTQGAISFHSWGNILFLIVQEVRICLTNDECVSKLVTLSLNVLSSNTHGVPFKYLITLGWSSPGGLCCDLSDKTKTVF